MDAWRPSSGTAEDRNFQTVWRATWGAVVAAVLRDGRGSQRPEHAVHAELRRWWRPSSGAAEDRKCVEATASVTGTAVWRPSPGTAEDRNAASTFGSWDPAMVAAVLRDGRGSQRPLPAGNKTARCLVAAFSGTAEDHNDGPRPPRCRRSRWWRRPPDGCGSRCMSWRLSVPSHRP